MEQGNVLGVLDLEGNKQSPADCKAGLIRERDRLDQKLHKLIEQIAGIGQIKNQLDRFFVKYGSQKDPGRIFTDLKLEKSLAGKEMTEAQAKLDNIKPKLPGLKEVEKDLKKKRDSQIVDLNSLEQWQKESDGILTNFPGATIPEDIEKILSKKLEQIESKQQGSFEVEKLLGEKEGLERIVSKNENKIGEIERELHGYQKEYAVIEEFKSKFPGITPDQFLKDVQKKVNDFQGQITALNIRKKQ